MKALFYNKPGLNNLIFADYPLQELKEKQVLIEVKCTAVNPIDYFAVTGYHGNNGPPMNINPFPHIAGSEIAGIVKKKGEKVPANFKEGDRIIIYNRIFDGTCKYCNKGYEMLCNKGGLIGVITNGGFAEYIIVPYQNIIQIPDNIDWDLGASLPIAGLTAYNAVKEARLQSNESIVIFGGSGNTGLFCSQLCKVVDTNTTTISISKHPWIKDYGVDHVLHHDTDFKKEITYITKGEMADVVINSIGERTWKQGMEIIGKLGRIITFGVLTGGNLLTEGRILYNNQITIKGTTGGRLQDLKELVQITADNNIRTKVWKRFNLEESQRALESVFDEYKEGRIMIKNY